MFHRLLNVPKSHSEFARRAMDWNEMKNGFFEKWKKNQICWKFNSELKSAEHWKVKREIVWAIEVITGKYWIARNS